MNSHIRNLYIMQDNGIMLYSYNTNQKIDPVIFGGMMSALNIFAKQLDTQGLSNFELDQDSFYFARKWNLIFIMNVEKLMKPKAAREELQAIVETFTTAFPKEFLDRWNGNASLFDGFSQVFEAVPMPVTNFNSAFW